MKNRNLLPTTAWKVEVFGRFVEVMHYDVMIKVSDYGFFYDLINKVGKSSRSPVHIAPAASFRKYLVERGSTYNPLCQMVGHAEKLVKLGFPSVHRLVNV